MSNKTNSYIFFRRNVMLWRRIIRFWSRRMTVLSKCYMKRRYKIRRRWGDRLISKIRKLDKLRQKWHIRKSWLKTCVLNLFPSNLTEITWSLNLLIKVFHLCSSLMIILVVSFGKWSLAMNLRLLAFKMISIQSSKRSWIKGQSSLDKKSK